MRKAALLSLSVTVTAVLMAGYASKPAQIQTSAAQTQEAQTQAAGQSEAPKEESKETGAKADNGEVYELYTSSNQAQSGTMGCVLELFCETAEERPGGGIKTTVNFGNELGSQSEQVETRQADALEMAAAAPRTGLGVQVPELQMSKFPFLFRDNEEYREVIKAMGPEVSKRLEQHGSAACDGQFMGVRNMPAVTPVTKLEDMKGFKMRGPNNIYISMLDCLGMFGTTMDRSEVYAILQTKVMDRMEASPSTINSMRFQGNARNLAATNHCMTCIMHFFNKDWYDSPPRDLQQTIMGLVDETVTYQARVDDENNGEALEGMKAEGVVTTEIQSIDKWKEAYAPMLGEYRAKGDSWNSFIDMILEAQE